MTALETLATFDIAHIPNLDVVVLGALERFSNESLPKLRFDFLRTLVLGSGNAFMAAQIIFSGRQATFADESTFEIALSNVAQCDAVVVMSASGGKHAVAMTEYALKSGLPVYLVTNTEGAKAAALLPSSHVYVFPKNREPYTYNTSTYLGPILATTGEDVAAITQYIKTTVQPRLLRNFDDYSAYTFLIPNEYQLLRTMLRTKFDELFGPRVVGRIFTEEEVKHAKTVIVSGDELFISFGVENAPYGLPKNRLNLPLPPNGGYGTMLAATYYVVGKIQAAHPPYFAQSIEAYAKVATQLFGQPISPIVE